MLKPKRCFWIAGILTFIVPIWADSQTPVVKATPITGAGSSTNSPPVSALVAIALPKVVSETASTTARLREIDTSLSSDITLTTVDVSLTQITREIDEQQASYAKLLNSSSSSSLALLQTAQLAWHTLDKNIKVPQRVLIDRVTMLDEQLKQLDQWSQIWQATLALAKSSSAPQDVLQKINGVLAAIGQTTVAAQNLRAQTLSEQDRIAEQNSRIQDALAATQTAQDNAVSLLFTRNSAPLWSHEAYLPQTSGLAALIFIRILRMAFLSAKTAALSCG
jgi:hypothetical protein